MRRLTFEPGLKLYKILMSQLCRMSNNKRAAIMSVNDENSMKLSPGETLETFLSRCIMVALVTRPGCERECMFVYIFRAVRLLSPFLPTFLPCLCKVRLTQEAHERVLAGGSHRARANSGLKFWCKLSCIFLYVFTRHTLVSLTSLSLCEWAPKWTERHRCYVLSIYSINRVMN